MSAHNSLALQQIVGFPLPGSDAAPSPQIRSAHLSRSASADGTPFVIALPNGNRSCAVFRRIPTDEIVGKFRMDAS
jgi:hypothetical protein